MSLFVFSLLAGLLLHQIISIIQPLPGKSQYRVGRRIVVEFREDAYLIWKAGSLAFAVVLFFLVIIIIITQSVHPSEGYAYRLADVLTSPRMAAAIFGGLVGILLGNLLNRLLKNDSGYKFTSSDRLQILLIFALVILGIGGEEWLRSSAQRINKISVGTTTEISFAEGRPRSSRAAAEQPNNARRTTTDQLSVSAGLGKLGDLKDNIRGNPERKYRSDAEFIAALALYEQPQDAGPAAKPGGDYAADVLSPVGTCLSGIFRLSGDNAFIQQRLAPLSEALRGVLTSTGAISDKTKANLKEEVRLIGVYYKTRTKELDTIAEDSPDYSCKEIERAEGKADDGALMESFRDSKLPYAAMAYASVMAALQHYEAAAITMFNWIEADRKLEPADRKKSTEISKKWYSLRARFAQGSFIEEWIRVRGLSAPSSLRQYHIDNLKSIADDMQSFKAIWEMSRKNNDYKLTPGLLGATQSGDDGQCDVPKVPKSGNDPERTASDDEQLTLKKLYESFLSARKDYIDHALKHPILKIKSASIIGSEIAKLMAQNLRCVEVSRQPTIRAEHIERFVRSEINLMENTSSLKSTDEIRRRIKDTQQYLSFAFQLVEGAATRARDAQANAKTLQDRLQQNRAAEVYETLFATQELLRDFSEREVTP